MWQHGSLSGIPASRFLDCTLEFVSPLRMIQSITASLQATPQSNRIETGKIFDSSEPGRLPSKHTPSRYWRPLSFRRATLICTTLATFAFLGSTFALHLIDFRYGSIFHVFGGGGLSAYQIFLVRYLPTILVVIYGTWISMLDLDIKRLEPWFQLSTLPGNSKDSPLVCRYDTDFVLAVLVKSIRKKHWIVFGSSILLLTATIVLPAVQSSMLTTRRQDVQRSIGISSAASLANIENQKFRMTNNFLLSAYAVTWLNQAPPAFCTDKYALAPFAIDYSSPTMMGTNLSGITVTGSTTRYWSELSCWSPASIQLNFSSSTVSFDDGRGCKARDLLSFDVSIAGSSNQSTKYEAYQYGIGSFGFNPYLPSLFTQCPDRPHLTLATWRRAGPTVPDFAPGGNASAIFCEPMYYFEAVDATVKISDFSVVDYLPTGPRTELSDDIFNKTHFEYISSSGSPPQDTILTNITLNVDIADAMYVGQETRILNMSVITPVQQSKDVMVGFALGTTQYPVDTYLDPNTLSMAYSRAHQLLFVHAVRRTFLPGTAVRDTTSIEALTRLNTSVKVGTLTEQEEIARLVPGFAFAMEAVLILTCALCTFLLLELPRRSLSLSRNPDSLAETMVMSRSHETQAFFTRSSLASEQMLEDKLHESKFHIDLDEHGPLLAIAERSGSDKEPESHSIPLDNTTISLQNTKHPNELSWTITSLIGCLLVGVLVLFIVLNSMIERWDGIDAVPGSESLQQFLLNSLPTATATFLGIYLMLLCRIYSFVIPMHDLLRGNATARRTLLVNYTSLPPQLLFMKALKSQHYLLGALSVAALLSNVLTVTTASLFDLRPRAATVVLDLTADFNPIIIGPAGSSNATTSSTRSSALDAIYPNAMNLSDNVRLPSWTTTQYGFMPVSLSAGGLEHQVSQYTLEALGYGADLDCTDLLTPSAMINGSITYQNDGTTFQVWANFSQVGDDAITCVFDLQHENFLARLNLTRLTTTTSALEISNAMSLWNGSVPIKDDFCAGNIVKGWLRAKATNPEAEPGNLDIDYNKTIVVCKPRLKTRPFSLNVTASGDILSVQALDPASYDFPASANLSSTFRTAISVMRDFKNLPQWHQDTVARDWSNYLFQEFTGNRDLLNASMSPPTVEEASPVLSSIFSRLFAVQLSIDRVKLQRVTAIPSLDNTNASSTTTTIPVTAHIPTQKLFLSKPNLLISLTILTLDLIVLIVLRLTLPAPFLPRMPFTIASQIAFFAGSHVIDDVVRAGGDFKELDERGFRYGYGRFIGRDGWLHVGIEREGFVTKL